MVVVVYETGVAVGVGDGHLVTSAVVKSRAYPYSVAVAVVVGGGGVKRLAGFAFFASQGC